MVRNIGSVVNEAYIGIGLSKCNEHANVRLRTDVRIDINGGEKILLRLRPAHAPDTFYDEEEIVHTMLHEVRALVLSHDCPLIRRTVLRS